MKPNFFIMKVAGSCNLACKYCFAEGYLSPISMSLEILKRIMSEIDSLEREEVTLSWHGGEPLLLGKNTFRKALEYQRTLKTKFLNVVQTNGLLLDNEWAEIFKEYKFGVGLSLDGYREVHDFNRPLKNGQGSFDKVIEGLESLQKSGISVGIISVLTDKTEVEKYFRFVKVTEGIISFNPKSCNSDWEGSMKLESYTSVMEELFDLWIQNDDPSLQCRTFTGFAENLIGGRASLCNQSGRCGEIVSINTNGDVYPCDELIDSSVRFGNILEENIQDIFLSPVRKAFLATLGELHSKCRSDCSAFSACRGGCTSERLYYGDMAYCSSRRAIIAKVSQWVSIFQGGESNGKEAVYSSQ